jgi:hypothetical protein
MSPTYERLEWIHGHHDEPRFIYSELDDERYETRKIEIFRDGRVVKVSVDHPECGSTGLAVLPVPSIEETNVITQEEFHAEEIRRSCHNRFPAGVSMSKPRETLEETWPATPGSRRPN